MAGNADELDIIKHLIQIEKKAAELVDDATVEAEKRIADARSKYNADYKEKYDVLVKDLDSEYKKQVSDLEKTHQDKIEQFKHSMEAKELNTEKFNKLLESYLFSE